MTLWAYTDDELLAELKRRLQLVREEEDEPIRTYWVSDSNNPTVENEWAEYPNGWNRPTGKLRVKQ